MPANPPSLEDRQSPQRTLTPAHRGGRRPAARRRTGCVGCGLRSGSEAVAFGGTQRGPSTLVAKIMPLARQSPWQYAYEEISFPRGLRARNRTRGQNGSERTRCRRGRRTKTNCPAQQRGQGRREILQRGLNAEISCDSVDCTPVPVDVPVAWAAAVACAANPAGWWSAAPR